MAAEAGSGVPAGGARDAAVLSGGGGSRKGTPSASRSDLCSLRPPVGSGPCKPVTWSLRGAWLAGSSKLFGDVTAWGCPNLQLPALTHSGLQG